MSQPARRILSIWFPRLGAERLLRHGRRDGVERPMAVVGDDHGAQVITAVSALAEQAGLRVGQGVRDATAMCPDLRTAPADPAAEAAFLSSLARWAARFSPWVAPAPPDGLLLDLTGCAHLFGGEAALVARMSDDCTAMGLSVAMAVADTVGAAWALAHYGQDGWGRADPQRSGNAIAQEARATRSRAARRPTPAGAPAPLRAAILAPVGRVRQAIAGLPVAALRLEQAEVAGLARLGLHRVDDIAALPRAALARRFGAGVLRRLDQALGLEAEPISPAGPPLHFAARLSLPEPIGLLSDVTAAIDRILPVLCARLRARGRGARRLRLQAYRTDGTLAVAEVGLARAADTPDRIAPLLQMRAADLEAGFGFDMLRIEAFDTEPLHPTQHRGHLEAGAVAAARGGQDTALDDLLAKLGTRLGPESVTRLHPANSHIPEKAMQVLQAAWSQPHPAPWPRPPAPRPVVMFRPEPVTTPDAADPSPPPSFRWRRRDITLRMAAGPERIAPEWWLDDPDWRSGPRDYWRVEGAGGERLWLFFAHGGDMPGGWFCHGVFA